MPARFGRAGKAARGRGRKRLLWRATQYRAAGGRRAERNGSEHTETTSRGRAEKAAFTTSTLHNSDRKTSPARGHSAACSEFRVVFVVFSSGFWSFQAHVGEERVGVASCPRDSQKRTSIGGHTNVSCVAFGSCCLGGGLARSTAASNSGALSRAIAWTAARHSRSPCAALVTTS